jgi:DNA repair photolyase
MNSAGLELSYWESPPAIVEENTAKIAVKETKCSSLLHTMNFGSTTEYTINQYRGCSHGCVYCYAPSLIHDDRSWGAFVDVKVNAHSVLDRELDRVRKLVVFVSSASDPYQPVEAKFRITRKVLQILSNHQFPVLLLTRSPLVLRDMDVLKQLDWVRVGFSISTVPTRFYEPGVPSVDRRLQALYTLRDNGIKTWISMAPIIPSLVLTNLDWLFGRLQEAEISALGLGLLRFNGYEKSKEMFEERTGKTVPEVMSDGATVYQEISAKAKSYGLDTSGDSLAWRDSHEDASTLDRFAA